MDSLMCIVTVWPTAWEPMTPDEEVEARAYNQPCEFERQVKERFTKFSDNLQAIYRKYDERTSKVDD